MKQWQSYLGTKIAKIMLEVRMLSRHDFLLFFFSSAVLPGGEVGAAAFEGQIKPFFTQVLKPCATKRHLLNFDQQTSMGLEF